MELEPKFRKRMLSFVALGVFGFFILGALGLWGAFAAYERLANFSVSPSAKTQLHELKKDLTDLPTVNTLGCYDKIQTLLGLRPWMANPLLQNLGDLKTACLETKSVSDCRSPDCSDQIPINENARSQSI